MLKPEYFENKEDQMLEMFRELENFLLNDISQRLLKAGEMSGTADRSLWKTRQLGLQRDEILKKLSSMTGKTTMELKELLRDAVLTSWKDDKDILEKMGVQPQNPLENPAFMEVINAQLKKSKGELSNLTRTTMKQAQKDLITLLNEADMRVASGIQSYSSAVCQILDEYAGKGIRVEYAKRSISLEAAVRMCVVTSMNQTTAQLTNAYIEEAQAEYVLVSAHAGARYDPKHPDDYRSHDHWQGRAYKINGSEEGYPNLLKSTGYDIRDGVGVVVKPEGLHGYNCRHSHQLWAKGLRNPYMDENGKLSIDTEESRKLYDLKQKQRAMERAIRKTKRQLLEKQTQIDLVAEIDYKPLLQSEYDKLAYKLRQQNKAYNDFCEENDLAKASDRLKVSGFKKKQASAANGRATAYSNANSKIIKTNNTIESANKTASDAIIKQYNHRVDDLGLNYVPYKELDESTKKQIGADFTGMDARLANATAKQFSKLSSEYETMCTGISVGKLDAVSAPAGTVNSMNVQDAKITFNKSVVKDYDKFMERMKTAVDRGQFPKIPESQYENYVITHEFTHTLFETEGSLKNYVNADTKYIEKARKEIKFLRNEYQERVRKLSAEFKDLEKKSLETFDPDIWDKAVKVEKELKDLTISNYASENADEFMAEAFAEAKLSKDPSPYSIKVLEVIDKYFKKT